MATEPTEGSIFGVPTIHRGGIFVGRPGNGYVLPTAPGSANHVLKSDGSGNVSFAKAFLTELSDVNTAGAVSGNCLGFNGSNWVPTAPACNYFSSFTKTVLVPAGLGSTNLVSITLDTGKVGVAFVNILVLGHNDADVSPVVLNRSGSLSMNGSGTVTWSGGLDFYQTPLAFPTPTVSGATLTQSMNQNPLGSRTAYVVVQVIPQFGRFAGLLIA